LSSPATTQYFRLPSQAEARRVLIVAHGAAQDSPEFKAVRNLCKGLQWAFGGLTAPEKQAARDAYAAGNLETDLQLAMQKPPNLNDNGIIALLIAITSANAGIQHTGGARLAVFTVAQAATVDLAIQSFTTHQAEIQAGRHDDKIDIVFPGSFWVRDATRHARVKQTFASALAAINRLRAAGQLKLDSYSQGTRTGALTNPERMAFSPTFFGNSPAEQEATLVHESTHAIPDKEGIRTGDNGGYIGHPKFHKSDLDERYLNASHFEAIIRLINGEVLPVSDAAVQSPPIVEASEAVRKAWDKAINLYLKMQQYHLGGVVTGAGNLAAIRDISLMMGLPACKGPEKDHVIVTEADLAAAENRVGRLGLMLGAVVEAAEQLEHEGVPVSSERILQKLVEMQGAIRKTTNNRKTVDMIRVLANMQEDKVTAFKNTIY